MWNTIKSRPLWLLAGILALVLIVWLGWRSLYAKPPAAPLITATVERTDIEDSVLASGAIQASQLINVGSQVTGQLKKVYVKVGDTVQRGQLIAEIDDITQRNSLRAAQDQVASLQAQKTAKQASAVLAQQNFERQQYMYQRDASSKADYQSARQALDAARADIKAIESQIKQYSVQVETAKANLGYTRISAPADGTVVSIVAKEGQTVSAIQSAPTIVKLANLDNMRIEAQISEADVPRIKPGMPAYFSILGDPDKKYDATLRAVEPGPINMSSYDGTNTDSASSSAVYYNGLFDVPNPEHKLRIQMTAQVTVVLQQAKGVLAIPSGALSRRGKDGSYTVRVATGEKGKQQVEQRKVQIGLNNRVQAEIKSGLKEGEQVVVGDAGANRGGTVRGPRMF